MFVFLLFVVFWWWGCGVVMVVLRFDGSCVVWAGLVESRIVFWLFYFVLADLVWFGVWDWVFVDLWVFWWVLWALDWS